jgi:hypothetical protein
MIDFNRWFVTKNPWGTWMATTLTSSTRYRYFDTWEQAFAYAYQCAVLDAGRSRRRA